MAVKGDEIIPVDRSKNLENIVLLQEWEKSKIGRGAFPYGISLHKSLTDLQIYINDYWDGMPYDAPDSYERQTERPYLVKVSDSLFKEIHEHESEFGIRIYLEREKQLMDNREIMKIKNYNR